MNFPTLATPDIASPWHTSFGGEGYGACGGACSFGVLSCLAWQDLAGTPECALVGGAAISFAYGAAAQSITCSPLGGPFFSYFGVQGVPVFCSASSGLRVVLSLSASARAAGCALSTASYPGTFSTGVLNVTAAGNVSCSLAIAQKGDEVYAPAATLTLSAQFAPSPAGYYGPSAAQPLPCPAGSAGASSGATSAAACAACLPGRFAASAGASACTACPAGTFSSASAATSSSACLLCSPPNYCPEASAAPLPCPGGTWGSDAGLTNASCSGSSPGGLWLPAGSLSLEANATLCPAGAWCPPGTAAPVLCQLGTYNPFQGNDTAAACLACGAGRFGNVTGLSGPFASQLVHVGTEDYWYFYANTCQDCPAGLYSATVGATACTLPCPQGSYCPPASSTPTLCPSGTWRAAQGGGSAMDCTECALGTISAAVGATSASTCQPCAAGSYNEDAGNMVCTQCPAMSYCPRGSAAPVACPANSFNLLLGSTSLAACLTCSGSQCAPGSFSLSGSTPCSAAPAGTYVAVCASKVTVVCPAGYACAAGATSPVPCTALPGYGCMQGSSDINGTQCLSGSYCLGGSTPPQLCACPGLCGSVGMSQPVTGSSVWAVSTVVGTGVASTLDGPGLSATTNGPYGLTSDTVGNVCESPAVAQRGTPPPHTHPLLRTLTPYSPTHCPDLQTGQSGLETLSAS